MALIWPVPVLSWNAIDPNKQFYSIYGTPSGSLANAYTLSKQNNAGFVYMTDATLADNPYASLPDCLSSDLTDTASSGYDTSPPTTPDMTSSGLAFPA